MKSSHERGLTLVELMLALSIVGMLVLLVGTLGVQTVTLSRESRIGLMAQQDMAFALSHFSEDVRKAAGIAKVPSSKEFALRQPKAGGFQYVTYRFAARKLQRGISAMANAAPTDWADVVDSKAFEVLRGDFDYFDGEGLSAENRQLIRRIDLVQLQVASLTTKETREVPVISAYMREPAQSRVLNGPAGDVRMDNASNKMFDFTIENVSDEDISIKYFDFVWPAGVQDASLKHVTIDGTKWQNHKKNTMGELPKPVTIKAGETAVVDIWFNDKMTVPLRLTMSLYASADTEKQAPYVVPLLVLPMK